jgi:hypothetical protein
MMREEGQRKQPRKRRAETDEECIEEMFSQVGMEQDEDGYHVVLKNSIFFRIPLELTRSWCYNRA